MTCASPAWAQSVGEEPSQNNSNMGLEEITVTGQRQSLESAIELKRASDTIADSIVLDEAGKVPSTSLLEILERSPGVTMNRVRAGSEGSPDGFAFEGSGIQVRGLNKTKTLINGREVFSANGGSGLSWADVGPELLKAVTVYKASRADLIEGGVSGTVNLETHMPFDFDGFKANAAISGSYGDYSEDFTPAGSAMVSNRFDTGIGEVGVLLDVAYSKISSHDSNIIVPPYYASDYNGERVYVPGGVRYTQDQFERVRKGYYGALQWRPDDKLEFFHTTFISERESDRDSQILALADDVAVTYAAYDGAEFDDRGVFIRGGISNNNFAGLNVTSNSSFTPGFGRTADHSTGFKYEDDGWDLSASYQYVKAESSSGKYSLGSAVLSAIPRTNMDMSGDRPRASFTTPLVEDPAQTGLSRINWLNMSNEGESHAIQVDANFDISEGFFKKLAVGARAANREETDSFVGTWWSATGRGWTPPVPRPYVSTAPEGDFYLEEFSDFFKGEVPPLGSVWIGTDQVNAADQFERVVNTYAACAPDLYYQCNNPEESLYLYGNPPNPNFDQLPSFYTTKHNTRSAHAMLGFANDSESWFLNFSGNIGVRWVDYDIESAGNFTYNGGANYYASLEDAEASIEAMGGIENVQAWQEDNDGLPPLTQESVGYETGREGSFSKDYFLPSFNIKFEPAENWVMRYALTRTLTPPRYPDIRAQGTASVQTTENPFNNDLAALYPDDDVSIPEIFAGYNNETGNPYLEPEISLNHDLSFEWYPRQGSSVHLSLFHKTIDNYVTFNNFSAPANDFFSEGSYPQTRPINGGSSTFLDGMVASRTNFNAEEETIIQGFELGGRTYFDALPGWLSGFGIDANVTYIDNDSPDAFALDINGDELSVPVIGLSEWAYSTTLLYDWEKFSARLSWNWRDRYLTTTNDSGTTNVYADPFGGQDIQFGLPVYAAASGRLDGSIAYQLTDSVNIKLNVQNITDEDQRTEMEILEGRFVDRAVFVTDRRISLHLGVEF
ncbi:TonB-dependent receptor [Marinimicrobium sp. ARAG 43.8]|uniref:TonB-dependent receptor n=1 Tax=Marinimicrobium sp. ARAG 43.8 TaxID=3418719 RepID=UPI003CEA213B